MTGSKRVGLEGQFITHNEDLLREKIGEFRVGLKSSPYLADHCVQGVAVLPGSAYLEMLIIVCQRLYKQLPAVIRGLHFNRAIILTDDDAVVSVRLSEDSDKSVKCDFYEDDRANDGLVPADSFCSIAGIQFDNTASSTTDCQDFSVQQFQSRAAEQMDARAFYESLHSRGNQYGPEFQTISHIWASDTEALGKLTPGAKPTLSAEQNLGPVLLDSFAQLLSCLGDDKGRAFVLSSIEEIRLRRLEMPGFLWGHAKLLPDKSGSDKEFCGDVRVFDSSGEVYLEFAGVHCQYLGRESSKAVLEVKKYEICIASTFTADPVDDSLKFWSDYLGIQNEIRLAPYGQVLQQLLNPESIFRKNNRGVNIVLLGLEDLDRQSTSLAPVLSGREMERLFRGNARYTLPNGMEIAHLNKYETEYLFKEIFLDECYLRHGIVLERGSTIIDIGANIGLFSLFVSERCRDAKIYAFEPSPLAFDILRANCRLYGLNVEAFGLGVAERKKVGRFTFYKNASVFSGFQASEEEDRHAIRSVVRNMLNEDASPDTGSFEEYIDEILRGRLESTILDCQMLSVSDIIETNGIEKIDLLKIDAEKSELDVLQGIRDGDWPKIRQLVVEVHDRTGQTLKDVKGLLEGRGFAVAVEEEDRLKGSGLFNVYANKQPAGTEVIAPKESNIEKLAENLQLFKDGLDAYVRASTIPLIVGVCPRSPDVASNPEKQAKYDQAETRLLGEIGGSASVYAIDSQSLLRNCPVDQYFDSHTNKLGHIPYTTLFFASLGTSLARTLFALTSKPFKVLALDCDHTLWKGVCGEDGYQGVIISEPYKKIQALAVSQTESGMLVCLCSKNNESDALEVFSQREDMVLKRQHLAAWRLNWEPKSVNLKSLAVELNVGLDSFVFLDDNPVECADIRSNCPEVLTLKLPSDESKIAGFLENIWALDHLKLSSEDKKRTQMYQESAQRDAFLKKSLTLRDFLDGLKLEVHLMEPKPEQLGRVSQLTYRTNQFNFTTIRRTEAEISNLLADRNRRCLAVEVRDRFGDYGLVGVAIYAVTAELLKVDTFLLSCRVLGRGIEHRIMAELGRLATGMNIGQVEITYLKSGKNQPALEFMTSIGSNYGAPLPNGQIFKLPAEYLKTLKYEPPSSEEHQSKSSENKGEEGRRHSAEGQGERDGLSEKMQEIADHLYGGQAVLERIERFRVEQQSHGVPEYIEPGTNLEKDLATIWQSVLGKSRIGLTQNFFESGGTSLRAVQLIAAVKKKFGISLPLTILFECPTIALMAAKLGSKESGQSAPPPGAQEAMSRGARRRQAGFPRIPGR